MELIDVEFACHQARFIDHAEYERASFGGPSVVTDHYLAICKWYVNFNLKSNIM